MKKPRITIQRSLLDKLLERERERKEFGSTAPQSGYRVDSEIEAAFDKFTPSVASAVS